MTACAALAVALAAPASASAAGAAVTPVTARAQATAFSSQQAAPTTAPARVRTDFNNDGYDDLVVAAPGEGTGSVAHTGAITVIPGSKTGLVGTQSTIWTPCTIGVPGPCAANDRWGTTYAVGDFNGDGYSDIAVSAPQSIGTAALAGSVTILYGSAHGLTTKGARLLAGTVVGVPGAQRPFSLFGSSLAAGDFDGDGYSDLAIGVPGATIAGHASAGMVIIVRGSKTGLSTNGRVLAQGTSGAAGTPTAGNAFGQVLLADDIDADYHTDLVVGMPHADLPGAVDAGEIYRFWGSAKGLTTTNQAVVTGPAVAHRELGAALAGPPGGVIYASAPGNGATPADVDEVTAGRASPSVMFTAYTDSNAKDDYGLALLGANLGIHFNHSLVIGSPGYDGTGKVDAFDHHDIDHVITEAQTAPTAGGAPEFGVSLASGDYNGDGSPDLVIGEPGATVSGVAGAGQLGVMYSNGVGPDRSMTQVWNQESAGVPSGSEPGDNWGYV
ncbi:MAG TPA: FG-GAP-like repeat-containing protein [Acidimicrobiia bacterium]